MIDVDHYRAAQENVEERQAFLDGVDMEEFSPYVKSIIYRPGMEFPNVMAAIHSKVLFPHRGGPAHIFVSPFSFRYNPIEFNNSLLFHEGTHARQARESPINYWTSLLNTGGFQRKKEMRELEAYSCQVTDPDFFGCGAHYRNETFLKIIEHAGELKDLNVSMDEIHSRLPGGMEILFQSP